MAILDGGTDDVWAEALRAKPEARITANARERFIRV